MNDQVNNPKEQHENRLSAQSDVSSHDCETQGHIPEGLFDKTDDVEAIFKTHKPYKVEGHIPEGLFDKTDGRESLHCGTCRIEGHIPEGLFDKTDNVETFGADSFMGNENYAEDKNVSSPKRKKKMSRGGGDFITDCMYNATMDALGMLLMAMAVLLLSLVFEIPVWGWVLIGAYYVWSFGAMAHEIFTALKKKRISV